MPRAKPLFLLPLRCTMQFSLAVLIRKSQNAEPGMAAGPGIPQVTAVQPTADSIVCMEEMAKL